MSYHKKIYFQITNIYIYKNCLILFKYIYIYIYICFYFDDFIILVYNRLANITYNLLLLIYNSFKLYNKQKYLKS